MTVQSNYAIFLQCSMMYRDQVGRRTRTYKRAMQLCKYLRKRYPQYRWAYVAKAV